MRLLERYFRIRITAADPERELLKLICENVEITDTEWLDLLTVEITIKKSQFVTVRRVLEKDEINYRIVRTEGLLWAITDFVKRPVLIIGGAILILLACILPRYIFFVEILGNDRVPDRVILQQAEKSGIRFGTLAADVRSEVVKNNLLSRLPELQWVGVTTSGTVATIHVKERSGAKTRTDNEYAVSSIVATHDGVITQMNVYSGTPLIQVGQSVKKGDTLISGYTDCGLRTIAQQADGEIYAFTLRRISVISPVPTVERDEMARQHTCYRLRIGKKVINLCNHSGIHDGTCVKMYSEDYWTLPGGFQFPVSVMKVKCHFYHIRDDVDIADNNEWLMRYANEYLQTQMVAGEVLDESLIWNMSDDFCEFSGSYACHEMIGQVKREETIEQYAEDH